MSDNSIIANLARKGFRKNPEERTSRELSAMREYLETNNPPWNKVDIMGFIFFGITIGGLLSLILTFVYDCKL